MKKPRPARRPEKDKQDRRHNKQEDDRRLDEELAQTFPASDPPSIIRRASGVAR